MLQVHLLQRVAERCLPASRRKGTRASLCQRRSLQEPNGPDIQELGATASGPPPSHTTPHNVPGGPSYSSVGRWKGTLWAKLNGCWGGRMKRMTTADVGKEGKTADWTRASASTSVQRTLSCPALGTPQNIWLEESQPRLLPHLQTQKFNPSWTRPPAIPSGTSCSACLPVHSPYSLTPAPGCKPASPRGWRPARVSHSRTKTHSLVPSLGPAWGWNRALIHPVSLGDKRASPPLPSRGGPWGWHGTSVFARQPAPAEVGESPQTPRPTRVNLPAGPRRSCPPLSSSHFSWLPARSLLDLLPPRCQGALQFYM